MNLNQVAAAAPDIYDDVLDFAEIASFTTKRAVDEVNVHRQMQKRAAELAPAVLDHMLKNNVVLPQQKEAAAAMLSEHATTLQLLKVAVDKLIDANSKLTKKGGDLGGPADPATLGAAAGHQTQRVNGDVVPLTKEGEYHSTGDPFVGRQTDLVKESDLPLLALLNK